MIEEKRKTEELPRFWLHESDKHGSKWSRCPKCRGCVEGFVNYRFCPHCGDKRK